MPILYTQGALDAPSTPLNHARIGYDSVFRRAASVAASTSDAGTPVTALKNELTYETWKPTALPADVTVTLSTQERVDYVGIAGHTIGTSEATVKFEYWTGTAWVEMPTVAYSGQEDELIVSFDFESEDYQIFDDIVPGDDTPIMFLTGGVITDQIRVTVDGATIPSISVLYVGQLLEMYRPFYSGFTPGRLNRQTTVRPTKSVNGQWLGRSIIRESLEASFAWSNTPMQWYRGNVEPFALEARRYPFFIAWNAKEWPQDVLYAWTSDNMAPSFSQSRNRVSFGFSVEALDDGR